MPRSRPLPLDQAVAILKRDLLGIVPPGVLPQVMSSDTMAGGMSQPAALGNFHHHRRGQ